MIKQNFIDQRNPVIRRISLALVVLMIFSSMPVGAFAQNDLGSLPAVADSSSSPSDSPSPTSPPPTDSSTTPPPPPADTTPPASPSGSPSSPPTWTPSTSDNPGTPTPRPVFYPKVSTGGASDIQPTSATLNGSITDDGGGTITDAGFIWWSSKGQSGQVHTGSDLTYTLTGLTENTTYTFYAFASNISGSSAGSWQTFTTSTAPLVVKTLEATDIGFDKASLHGNITGGGTLVASGFCLNSPFFKTYSAVPGPGGSMETTISGLKPGVTYSFSAFATNDKGILYGSSFSFTTLKIVPKVDTQAPQNINMTAADLYGSVLDKGSSDIKESGFLWGTDSKPNNKVVFGNGNATGTFSNTLKNLKPDTTYYFQAYAANTEGIGYGPVLSFKTLNGKPQVETREADDITPVEANLQGYITNGDILANQKLPVTASGFLWGTSGNPDKKVSVSPAADYKTLSYLLKGLKPNTTYYYKAYATNSAGTVYGTMKSFKTLKGEPVVVSWDAGSVNATGAYLGASISNGPFLKNLGMPVTDSGFLFGTGSKPDNKVSVRPGTDLMSLDYILKGLKPNTTYYFQAYATNSAGTAYSGVFSFTTAKGLPEVETLQAEGITPVRAAIEGSISNAQELKNQGLAVTGSGFLWGTDPKPDQKVSVAPDQTGEKLNYTLNNLKEDTTYYFQAYATNSAGTSYGEVISFTTPNGDPEVETREVSGINPVGASLEGFIVKNKGLPITDSGFLIGTDPKLDQKVSCKPGADGRTFVSIIDGLKAETTYYVQAYATNQAGTGYGKVLSFKTINGDPIVETGKAEEIEPTSAKLNGFIKDNIGLDITESGFMLGTDSDVLDKKITVSPASDLKTLSTAVKDLEVNTTYYYKAYAVNIAGTGYGEVIEFSTATKAPKVETRPCGTITSVSGEINGFILEDYGYEITDSGFFWGTDPDPDTKFSVPPGSDEKSLAYLLSNLKGGTAYYVQAYAVNSEGIGYGEIYSFTTNPSVVPSVSTSSADFDSTDWQPVLKGNISSNGGDPVVEYGFRYSKDQKAWTTYAVGQDDYSGDFNANLTTTERLPVGTYYAQPYAVNSVGTGYGDIIKFVTPNPPVVTCAAASPATGATAATLTGNITNTGGKNIKCDVVQFQYRKAGEKDWQEAGIQQGAFGTGEFTFNLEGLDPGTKYEFAALARNCAGIGTSPIITFTTGWGTDAGQAAQNMKAAGFNALKIAGILKGTYKVDEETAYNALLNASFQMNDVISALKASTYSLTYSKAVSLMKGSEVDILTVAGILQNIYPKDMREVGAGYFDYERINMGIINCLKSAGYGVDDIISVMRSAFKYSIRDCYDKLGPNRIFTFDEAYGGLVRSFGGSATAGLIWDTTYKGQYFWLPQGKVPLLQKIAGILKKDGNLSAAEVAQAFKAVYPAIGMEELTGGLADAGYDIGDIGNVVADMYGNDPQILAKALLTYTGYSPSKIEDYLIKGRNASAQDMVRVISNVFNNDFRSFDEVPRVFSAYYNLDAESAAEAMYSAGYNFDYLVMVMRDYYHLTKTADIMGIFADIGLPSQRAIAKIRTMFQKYDWLKEYRIQGYSAADYAVYAKANPGEIFGPYTPEASNTQYGVTKRAETTIYDLVRAEYGLSDIASAIKNVYGFDEVTVLRIFTDANDTGRLNLNKDDIVAAIDQVYGTDSILASVKSMLNSGSSAVQLAMTLKDGFGIKDPEKAADYLVNAGCSESGIMDGLEIIYYNRSTSRDTIDKLNRTDLRIGSQNGMRAAIDSVMRNTGRVVEPVSIARLLNGDGYSLKEMSLIFKLNYSLAPSQVIDCMVGALGANKQTDIAAEVMAAFGTDIIPGYAQSLRNKGYYPDQCLSALKDMFSLTDPVKMATYMDLAGYGQDEVLGALLKILYNGNATADALKVLSDVLQKAYNKVQGDIAIILNAAGVKDASTAVHALYQDGYALTNIVHTLKDAYGLLPGDAIDALTKSLLFQQKDITSTVQAVYGVDFAQAFLMSMQSQGFDAKTIGSSGAIQILNKGAYPLADIIKALKEAYDLTPDQAIDVLTKSGLYQQKDIVAQIQAVYGLDNTQIYTQYLTSKGYSSDTIDSDAIKLLNEGGFGLTDIVKALKGINNLTSEQAITMIANSGLYSQKDIISQVQTVYGLNNSQVCIQYLQSRGYDIKTIDPKLEVQLLSQAGYRLEDITALFKDTNKLTAGQALDAITKSGLYDQHTIGVVLGIIYGGDLTPVYHQYLTDNGIDATSADYSGIIMVMRYGGYDLIDMVRALKDMYRLPSDKTAQVLKDSRLYPADAVDAQVQAIYSGDYVLTAIKYWQSQGNTYPTAIFDKLDKLGITDNTEKVSYLKKAGYSDNAVWDALFFYDRDDVFTVIKNLYMLNDPLSVIKQFQQIPALQQYFGMLSVVNGLYRTFPGISDVDMVKALKAAGYPVYGAGVDIYGWLISYRCDGKHDDTLISILGSAHPDDLNLTADQALEILYYKGYSMDEAVEWYLKDNYAWKDFFGCIVDYYAPKNYPQSYWDNNSSSKFIVAALKNKYGIDDLISGELGYTMGMTGKSSPDGHDYAYAYADLISAGYSMDEAVRGIIKQGSTGVSCLISIMYFDSICRANFTGNQSLRLSCSQIADELYTIGLTMKGVTFSLSDIARSLVEAGPNAGAFASFSKVQIHEAMMLITGKYLQRVGASAPVDITALYLLREGGLSASDAAATMADEKVGLSTGSIIKSMIGIGNDWMDAVTNLIGAGYSARDSISAVYCNKDYHNMIGVSILSSLTTKALTWLDDTGKVADIIKAIRKISEMGFKIGEM